jgi:hypothetical protein
MSNRALSDVAVTVRAGAVVAPALFHGATGGRLKQLDLSGFFGI